MRSGLLLASAMAMGAIAGPLQKLDKRYYVTEVELVVETVTIYVTAGEAVPTAQAPAPSKEVVPVNTPTPQPESSAPAPAPSSVYTPPPPPPAPTSVYTPPPPAPSSVVPSQAPAASAAAVNLGTHKSGDIQSTFSSGTDYKAAILFHHNVARANHGALPLTWDDTLAANAQWTANKCDFSHSVPQGVSNGQNLFTVSGDSFNVTAGITESWYKGEFDAMSGYWGANEIPDEVFHHVGHLTQMVWKGTTTLGCFSLDCSGKMTIDGTASDMNKYTVCNYAGPGNVAGQYATNVGKPLSLTNLGSWAN